MLSTENFPGYFHYHQGLELLYIHRGKGRVLVNQKVYSIESGTLFCFQPYQLHRVEPDITEDVPYERTALTFEPTTLLPFIKPFIAIQSFLNHIWKEELNNQAICAKPEELYLSDFFEYYNRRLSQVSRKEYLEEAALLTIQMIDFLRSVWDSKEVTDGTTRRMSRHSEKIMQWIDDHFMEEFKLDILAENFHLSRHHISHLFRKETGSTISEYLTARRIRQACWLLVTDSSPIEQIGIQVGIPNFSYFCRLFKQTTDVTPQQYRSGLSKIEKE
jgi:AraC-like DNA-binding protein